MTGREAAATARSEMGPFLRRVGAFGLLLCLLAAASALLNTALRPFHRPQWTVTPGVLLAGDSHMAMSVDPGRLVDAVSVARDRELMVVTYYKLTDLLEAGRRPATVVLSVAPHNFSKAWELDALNRPETAFEVFAVYYGLVPWFETGLDIRWSAYLPYLAKNTLTPDVHLIGDFLAASTGRGAERRHEYLGGFDPESGGELLAERLELGLQQYFGAEPRISEPEVEHFERLVERLGSAEVELVLLHTPAHPAQRARVPADIERAFRAVVERAARSSGVRVVDLSALPLPDDAWANHDHVNARGAAIVSDSVAAALAR